MPQNPRYGRSRSDWDDERDRNYARGRDDWRDESRSYRSSRHQDEGDHDRRQDRDYQGTLRAGDYGRYEEEEGRSYPERFGGGRGGHRGDYGSADFGNEYGRESAAEYGRGAYGGGRYGRRHSTGGYGAGGYSGREYGGRTGSQDYGGSGGGYGYYGGYPSGGSSYAQGGGSQAGFGEYVNDYEQRYGGRSSSGRDYRGSGDHGRNRSRAGDRDWWDRATDEVSSWFGDKDAERRRQMDHSGRGPKNYSRSDERIREDISDRLTDDPLIDASDIDVTVQNQEVTLSGHVSTRRQRRLAEEVAEEISGVKHVQNNLRVKDLSWSQGQSGSGSGGPTAFGTGGSTTM